MNIWAGSWSRDQKSWLRKRPWQNPVHQSLQLLSTEKPRNNVSSARSYLLFRCGHVPAISVIYQPAVIAYSNLQHPCLPSPHRPRQRSLAQRFLWEIPGLAYAGRHAKAALPAVMSQWTLKWPMATVRDALFISTFYFTQTHPSVERFSGFSFSVHVSIFVASALNRHSAAVSLPNFFV